MLTPRELEAMPIQLEQYYRQLEESVMLDIVRRMKNNGNDIIRSADWQINRLHELGKTKEEIKNEIQKALNISSDEVTAIYDNAIKAGYSNNADVYKEAGIEQVPYKDNKELQQLVSGLKEQTNGEFKNITQSLGFAVKGANGKIQFTPIADYYQKTLDGAILGIASGVFDYNTALKKAINEMTNSGLRSVDYASGWSNRVDVAARRAVMTGITQLTAKVNEDMANDLGTNTYEVSWHSGARPEHAEWQGGVYTYEELESICGLGDDLGLCGINCYHSYSPFIEGISERTYTDEELEQMREEENTPKEFNGKKYTAYEAQQRQRRLETTMRAERQKIKLLKEGGADEEDIIRATARYRGTSAEYSRFSKAMGLPQQRERVYGDGLGSVGKGKYKIPVEKSGKSGIIELYKRKGIEVVSSPEISSKTI
ncbi:MAG: phage minor capsid protein, partial [Clostridia bacterium]|nr:phage minor capsid protein [Clostridia bacterium]